MTMQIVTLTLNPSVDVSSTVDQVVADHKLRCGPAKREAGGGGVNVSRAISHLGGLSLAVYPKGGVTGDLLDQLLESEASLVRRPVVVGGWTRESFVIRESSTNRQFRFGLAGATLDATEWRECLDVAAEAVDDHGYLVISGSLPDGVPEDVYPLAAALVGHRGVRMVVDTSGPALGVAARTGTFLLKPNAGELAAMVGGDHLDEAAQEAAARTVIAWGGCEYVMVSLGAAGVLLVGRDGVLERIPAPHVRVRSRVGAGDSTLAGTVLAMARGEDVPAAARFGAAAGSAAVMATGTGLCRLDDTQRLHAGMVARATGGEGR